MLRSAVLIKYLSLVYLQSVNLSDLRTFKNNVTHLIAHTNTCIYIYIYILFKKSKIFIKTFKTLVHVSITRSSSGSFHCSLLKLQFKTFSELLRYVNFDAVTACRV